MSEVCVVFKDVRQQQRRPPVEVVNVLRSTAPPSLLQIEKQEVFTPH